MNKRKKMIERKKIGRRKKEKTKASSRWNAHVYCLNVCMDVCRLVGGQVGLGPSLYFWYYVTQ